MTASRRRTVVAAVATLLGAVVLTSVVQGGSWLWRPVGAVVLVAVVGWLLRRMRLPRLLVPPVQLAALLAYLTALFASGSAVLGLIPDAAALRTLRATVDQGIAVINEQAAPVTADPGIILLVVAGVGAVAVAVDLIAAAYGRAATGGLPLLALYSAPATTLPGGISAVLFLWPAIGFLLLLLADGRERLLRWGRPVAEEDPPADPDRPGPQPPQVVQSRDPISQLGRRIGATAIGLAVLVPAVLPLSDGVLARGRFGGAEGGGTIATLNPLVSLRRDLNRSDDVDVLRVRTNAPSPRDLYFRTVTLDTFDGQDWRASSREVQRFDEELPGAEGLDESVPQQPVRSRITATDSLQSDYLPLPYPATGVRIDGRWRVDPQTQNVVSQFGRKQISGSSYTVDSLAVAPTREMMAAAPAVTGSRYLDLPRLPRFVQRTAAEVTADADDPLSKALAIQDWLRDPDNFTYDLQVRSGTGTVAIVEFLRDRRGYCEQFAATMAVFARMEGIPARVNVGFTPGESQPDGSLVISAWDAHAWPELFFPGIGWVRFEPTPPDSSAGPAVPSFLAPPQAADPGSTATPSPQATSTAGPDRTQAPRDPDDRVGGVDAPAGGGPPWPWIGLAAAAVALAAAPAVVAAVVRRRRWASVPAAGAQAEAAWAEVSDSARDLGYGWTRSETPRRVATRLIAEGGLRRQNAEALTRISRALERTRYSAAAGAESDLRADVDRVRTALSAQAGRRTRLAARFFPASGRALIGDYLAGAAERVSAAVDMLAVARGRWAAQLRARLFPRPPATR